MSIADIAPFVFAAPPRLVVGWGAATDGRLADEAKRLGQKPFVVAGRSLRASGVLDTILSGLWSKGLEPVVYEGVPPEPSVDDLQSAIDALAAAGCDFVIAIGGGSVLDVAKGAAALAGHGADAARRCFAGRSPVPEFCDRPILAVPTTSGTGSETTWVGVFSDKSGDGPVRKASIRGGAMMPAVALLDAALTVSCPVSVTVHSGLDAFVQAVEAYTSLGANPLTDALASEAARLASYENVAIAAREPQNRPARESLALGSLMAGMALNTSRLGLVHGLAHPIGAITGAPHGLLCGVLLLPVMRFNRDAAALKYARLAQSIFDADKGKFENEQAAADALIEDIAHCIDKLSLPSRLSEIGLRESDLDRVAKEAMTSGSTKANPRLVSEADARALTAANL